MLENIFSIQRAYACSTGAICPAGNTPTTGGSVSLSTYISNSTGSIVQFMLLLGGVLAVIYIIYMGIQYISSAGNADKAKLARGGIINAIIGIVVIMTAYFIVHFAVTLGTAANCVGNSGSSGITSGSSC